MRSSAIAVLNLAFSSSISAEIIAAPGSTASTISSAMSSSCLRRDRKTISIAVANSSEITQITTTRGTTAAKGRHSSLPIIGPKYQNAPASTAATKNSTK